MDLLSNSTQTFGSSVNLSIFITTLAVLLIHFYYGNLFTFWSKKGLAGPKPLPVLGNLLDLMSTNRLEVEKKFVKNYGKLYGYYMGRETRLVVADPEVALQITVKDFHLFQNHNLSDFGNSYQKNFLFFLENEDWKKARSLMTPTFTSGKIKRMFKFLDICADDLVKCFNEQIPSGSSTANVNAKELYNLFTMDAITTCCYGLKLERNGSTNLKSAATRNDFVRAGMRLFDTIWPRVMMGLCLPKAILKPFGFQVSPDYLVKPLHERVEKIIDFRRSDAAKSKKFDDYLQLLMDARLDDAVELNHMDSEENHHAGLSPDSILDDQKKMVEEVKSSISERDLTMSDQEVIAHAIFLLAVGLETTGTLLTNCTYALAFHPEIQERLHKEVMSIAEYDADKTRVSFSYEALTSCMYLDAVISETLRLLCPVVMVDRTLQSDYRIDKYNLELEKGQVVFLAYYAMMNDPDYWEEPEKFNPERFMPGNREKIVPGSYCPFGLGPRHCIGMRFSLTESKLALAKMIANYSFHAAPGTKFPPPMQRTIILVRMKDPRVVIRARKGVMHED